MKKLAFFISFLILISSFMLCAYAEDSYEVRSGIQWGMTIEQVEQVEGAGNRIDVNDGVMLDYETASDEKTNLLSLKGHEYKRYFYFRQDSLESITYSFDHTKVDLSAVGQELYSQYGTSIDHPHDAYWKAILAMGSLISRESIQSQDCTAWKLENGTMILFVLDEGHNEGFLLYLAETISDETRKVTMGRYEQDGNTENGPENIEWEILDYDEDQNTILLISDKVLEMHMYHTKQKQITWKTSDLRHWMNTVFMFTAFSDPNELESMKQIATDSENGEQSEDYVACLSLSEAERYFLVDADRKAEASQYLQNRVQQQGGKTAGQWWLRADSEEIDGKWRGYDVFSTGKIGRDVLDCSTIGIRPVICVNANILLSP